MAISSDLNRLRGSDVWIAAGLMGSALIYHLTYVSYGPINLIDTGIYAADAMRVLHGEVYGRDFMAPYGPMGSYALAFWFLAFDESLAAATGFWLTCLVIVHGLHYGLARRFLGPIASIAVVLCFVLAHGPLHKVLVSLVLTLGALGGLWGLEGRGRRAFVVGIGFALLGLIRWDTSTFIALAFGLSLVLSDRPSRALWFLGGGLCGVSLVLTLYALLSNPSMIFQFTWERVLNTKNAPSLFGDGEGVLLRQWLSDPSTLFLFALSFVVALWGALRFFSYWRRGEKSSGTMGFGFLVIGGILALNQARLLPKYERLSESWILLLTVFYGLLDALLVKGNRRPWLASLFLLPVLGLGVYNAHATWFISQASWSARGFATSPLELERGGSKLQPGAAQNLATVVRYIQGRTSPEDPIFVTPNIPAVLFLADRRTPSPVNGFVYIYKNEDMQERIVKELEADPPKLVVTHDKKIIGFEFDREAPLLRDWIVRNYTPEAKVARYQIWRAKGQ